MILSIDRAVKEKARKYAKLHNASLSGIIENYLKVITSDQGDNPVAEIKTLKGSFKAPKSFDYKNELSKALNDKYL